MSGHLDHYEECPELHRVDELIEDYYLKGDYETCFRGCLELAEKGYSRGTWRRSRSFEERSAYDEQ